MRDVAFHSPFVPPEWIAAHQLRPVWLRLSTGTSRPLMAIHRGVCRAAGVLTDQLLGAFGSGATVLTTVCDQMRYAAAHIQSRSDLPVFLLNVPSTWETPDVKALYRDELLRLGRFLETLGGQRPSQDRLIRVMIRYDDARQAARENWPCLDSPQYATVLAELRSSGSLESVSKRDPHRPPFGIPLAIVGGPLLDDDYALLQSVARAGGRIVLDASEGGERTLPASFNRQRLADDPISEMARAYFDEIPAVFRRPNHRMYQWLEQKIVDRGVRGILWWRHLFCDLWHAELEQIRQCSSLPVLDIDASEGDAGGAKERALGRIEAFLEMLQ